MEKYDKYLLTSESVTEGHPDKVCDFIADSILDGCLMQDCKSRVAVEVLISNNKVVIAGQITSNAHIDIETITRNCLKSVDYTDKNINMDHNTCIVDINITNQSNDIANGVDIGGAGDQGIMFGYATDESENYMPYTISTAHLLSKKLSDIRKNGSIPYLKSDGKVQVTAEYINNVPIRIDKILISTQHAECVDLNVLKKDIMDKLLLKYLDMDMIDKDTEFYINPTGSFVVGGPLADTGLTGRKIIVDTYGGIARHGGGAFSGKDPTKVDRSGAYMMRHIAKNIVANKLAKRCELQIAYGIGLKEPLSLYIDCFRTNNVPENYIIKLIREKFDLSPSGIIDYLDLEKPIYAKTSNYGHFGRNEFTWEKIIKL